MLSLLPFWGYDADREEAKSEVRTELAKLAFDRGGSLQPMELRPADRTSISFSRLGWAAPETAEGFANNVPPSAPHLS